MGEIFTVGHGARSLDEFLALLREAEIEVLVDVRRFPGSRRHPHFAREALEASLGKAGIELRWEGTALGGRRSALPNSRHLGWRSSAFQGYADHMDTDEFRIALRGVIDLAQQRPVAIMCAETLWWNCHRRLIADALTLQGLHVVHLVRPGERQDHVLHEAARPDEQRFPIYDLGTQQQLL